MDGWMDCKIVIVILVSCVYHICNFFFACSFLAMDFEIGFQTDIIRFLNENH